MKNAKTIKYLRFKLAQYEKQLIIEIEERISYGHFKDCGDLYHKQVAVTEGKIELLLEAIKYFE